MAAAWKGCISKEHIACPVLYGSATGISCLEEGGHHYDLVFFKDIENRVRWGKWFSCYSICCASMRTELGPPDPCKTLSVTVIICKPSAGHREETGGYLKILEVTD